MRSLFWKIFLSFWLAMILMGIVIAWSTAQISKQFGNDFRQAQLESRFSTYTDVANTILKRGSETALRGWIRDLSTGHPYRVFLLGPDGKDILGRFIPPPVRARLKLDSLLPPLVVPGPGSPHLQFLVTPLADERYRLLLISHRRGPPLHRRLPALYWGLRTTVALLISGTICFFLTRYVVRPIRRLQRAARALSSGQLDTRVVSTLGKRNDEMAELGQDFDTMAERLEILVNSQKQLLRDMSHELRSPLARLQVALELARRDANKQTATELDRIEREAIRLDELISQVLSLSRLESGAMMGECEPVELKPLLEGIVKDAAYEISDGQQKGIDLLRCDPITLHAHRELLCSAIENVVRNALRYTVENTSVQVSASKNVDNGFWITIQVRDFGPGVPAEALDRLFEPFVRVGEARDRGSGGYGLGLAIAKQAIRWHNGRMSAHNDPEGGLAVSIHLPI